MSVCPDRISITSLAGFKRAMGVPGVIVILDRNDYQAHFLARNPGSLAAAAMPATVMKLQTESAKLARGGRDTWMNFPKAANFRCDGTNVVTFLVQRRDDEKGEPYQQVYRLELAGTPGALIPSRLPEAHPAVADTAIEEEKRLAAGNLAREKALFEAGRKALEEVKASPRPTEDPRWSVLRAAMVAAIEAALDRGVYYNDPLEAAVVMDTSEVEFAVHLQLPDLVIEDHGDRAGANVRSAAANLALAFQPRGTWRRTIHKMASGHEFSDTHISTGRAETAEGFEGAFADRGGLAPFLRLIEREVYDLRQEVENARTKAKADAALAVIKPSVGKVFRDVQVNSTKFSSLTIEEIAENNAYFKVALTKRGSRRLYNSTMTREQFTSVFL